MRRREGDSPVLYIMCGLPFAGKSTVAKRLAITEGADIIELDALNTECESA